MRLRDYLFSIADHDDKINEFTLSRLVRYMEKWQVRYDGNGWWEISRVLLGGAQVEGAIWRVSERTGSVATANDAATAQLCFLISPLTGCPDYE